MGEKKRREAAGRRDAWINNARREMAATLGRQFTQTLCESPRRNGKSTAAKMLQDMRETIASLPPPPEAIHFYVDASALVALERKIYEMGGKILSNPLYERQMTFHGIPIEVHPVGTFMYHPESHKLFEIKENQVVTAPPGFKPFTREEVMGKVVEL